MGLSATGVVMISAGYSTTLAQVHAARSIPSAASRTLSSRLLVLLPTPILSLPLLLLHLHLHHPLLSTTLSTCMEISAQPLKIVLFAVRTAIIAINLIPSKTLSNGTLLMLPADAFPTNALLKATLTLRLSIAIIKTVSAMAAATAA